MMKYFNVIIIYSFLTLFFGLKQGWSQNQKLEVISSAGDFSANSNYNVTWTVGEPVIKTIGNGTHFITQGFNQTQWVIVGVWNYIPTDIEASVYPNPMSTDLNLSFPAVNELQGKHQFVVYDLLYKPVFISQIESEEENYDLSFLSNGTYLVQIMDEDGRFLKTFKIIKNR